MEMETEESNFVFKTKRNEFAEIAKDQNKNKKHKFTKQDKKVVFPQNPISSEHKINNNTKNDFNQLHMVSSIQFGILGPKEIINLAEVEVNQTDFYENGSNYIPKEHGVLDPRMGSIDKHIPCRTCKQDFINCPGHWGYIALPLPILHYSWIKDYLIPILKCVCFQCGKLRIPKSSKEYKKYVKNINGKWKDKMNTKLIRKLKQICSKSNVCQELVSIDGQIKDLGCGQLQPKYKFVTETIKIRAIFPSKTDVADYQQKIENEQILATPNDIEKDKTTGEYFLNLDAKQIEFILQNVDEEDYFLFGFNNTYFKPTNMVLHYLLVPPICLRLPNKASNTKLTEDWLTKQYQKIVQHCLSLKEVLQQESKIIQSHISTCHHNPNQVHSANYNNSSSTSTSTTNHEPFHNVESHKKLCPSLKTNLIQNQQLVDLHWQALTTDISFLFDTKSFPERPRAASNNLKKEGLNKGFVNRLGSKEGRFRRDIQGKRFDYSSRAVLNQDDSLKQDQLGVPLSIAMKMTVPQIVTNLNQSACEELVLRGAFKYPGCNEICKSNGEKIDLKICSIDRKQLLPLPIGTKLERHIIDGDYLLANRQPSLHRTNMIGFKAKVIKNIKSYIFNEKNAACMNADFDGDEINVSPPRDQIGIAEMATIIAAPKNFITPQSNRPVMGFIQDSLIGSKLLTKKQTFLTKTQFLQLFGLIRFDYKKSFPILPKPAILKPVPLWTGKQLFSLVCPKSFNYKMESDHHIPNHIPDPKFDQTEYHIPSSDTIIQVCDGELMMGNLCKKSLGASGGSMIAYFFLYHGVEINLDFVNNFSKIAIWYVKHMRGFTLCAKDFKPEPNQTKNILETLKTTDQLIQKIKDSDISYHSKESKINRLLEQVTGKHTKNILDLLRSRKDNFNEILGIKGNNSAPSQIIGAFGQLQIRNGQRIDNAFHGRTLPHFKKGDHTSIPKGYIPNHFMGGFSPSALFHHSITARDASSETSHKVPETGYAQRKLSRFMEENKIEYDGTVRDCQGNIIQFQYGDDSFDNMRLLKTGYLPFPDMNLKDYKNKFLWNYSSDEKTKMVFKFTRPRLFYISNMMNQHKRETNQNILKWFKYESSRLEKDRKWVLEWSHCKIFCSPWNFSFLLPTLKRCADYKDWLQNGIKPWEMIQDIIHLQKLLLKDNIYLVEGLETSFMVQLRHELSSRKIIEEYSPTKKSWSDLLTKIRELWISAIIQPGEAIGMCAAQSMGEPTTQMNLNTFQIAGISEKNIQLGIPRMKEMIGASKNNHTPSIAIYLKPEYESNYAFVQKCAKRLVATYLHEIVIDTKIVPNSKFPLNEDKNWVQDYAQLGDDTIWTEHHLSYFQNPCLYNQFSIRLEINSNKLFPVHFTLAEMINHFRKRYQGLDFVYNDVYCAKPIIYIFLKKDTSLKKPSQQIEFHSKNLNLIPEEEEWKWAEEFKNFILEEHLVWGIVGIKKTYVQNINASNTKGFKSLPNDKPKYMIETEGETKKSFHQILELNWINPKKVYSTNMHDIYHKFGIEAARAVIIKEWQVILESYGLYVNPRHFSVAADVMTWIGKLEGFTRTAIGSSIRGDPNPIKNASFEKTWPNFQNAARFSQQDLLKGITEGIMFGKEPRIGTAMIGVFDQNLKPISTNTDFVPIFDYTK